MKPEQIKAEAEALSHLEANPGWEVMEKWIKDAIERCKDLAVSSKKVNSAVALAKVQAKYEAYTTLLYLKERRIQAARKIIEEESSGQEPKKEQ